jgi:hypothetical protein
MSQAADLLAREAEVIRILKVLSSESDSFVVIGGYAINALTSHRFSVDCDLVTDSKGLKKIDDILENEAYEALVGVQKHEVYGIRMKKYVKRIGGKPVSVEIFPREVSCRQTNGKWSYTLIQKNSSRSRVIGMTDSTQALVPRRELLLAMKVHAGRDTDLRDVTMLSERVDWQNVADFSSTGNMKKVVQQVESAIATITTKEFANSLKAEFALRIDVGPLVSRTIQGLRQVKKLL